MKNVVFWDVTQYSLVYLYRRFGGTFCLILRALPLVPSLYYGCFGGISRVSLMFNALPVEAFCSWNVLVKICRSTSRHILGDRKLQFP
jgi:hypothetical protein